MPAPDGEHFILNGEKLWCTNGTRAALIVVMAKTPTKDKPNATTAFVVENDRPGVEIVHRCRFMGLRALYNGVIRFDRPEDCAVKRYVRDMTVKPFGIDES